MRKLLLCGVSIMLCLSASTAQTAFHSCKVSIADFNSDEGRDLGAFKAEVTSEKPITTSYRFPNTKLFVTTSVLYMQASPYQEGSPTEQIILTLVLGKKAYSSIETEMRDSEVMRIARAVVPLKSFAETKLETIYLGRRQPVILTLECKK